MIPLTDLKAQYKSIKNEIDKAIEECIAGSDFIKGKAVFKFEQAFSEYIGTKYCVGCGNGTDALEIILTSLKIGPGDEVIVPALTWIATAEAVSNINAEPVFVDIDPLTYNIDPKKIEEKITKKTKVIIPVHLYGRPARMDEIIRIAGKNGLFVVEDCAQAHGAEFHGRKIGTFGIASAFSFFPSKNLGAFGDGGAIITNSADIADSARKLSNHGQLKEKHTHYLIGRNSRLDTIQASVLNVKLKYLDEWNKKRNDVASFYRSRLKDQADLILPYPEEYIQHVYHLFVIRSKQRKKIIELLDEQSISWGIHYPEALPFLAPYDYKNPASEDFTVARHITEEIISLPIYPEITAEQLNTICNVLLRVNL
jgi:dTDP-4-amino-4,6-dideoxygalactose transaminase